MPARSIEHPVAPQLDCLGVAPKKIEAGGTGQLQWSGLVYTTTMLPSGCPALTPGGGLSCLQGKAPARGTLEVSIDVTLDSASCAGGASPCPDPMTISAKKSFKYPDDTEVRIDVDP